MRCWRAAPALQPWRQTIWSEGHDGEEEEEEEEEEEYEEESHEGCVAQQDSALGEIKMN